MGHRWICEILRQIGDNLGNAIIALVIKMIKTYTAIF